MESAIKDLAQFNDTELFEIVSEGASHIVKNASRLDEAAKKLSGADDYHTSRILRHFASEEAAKVLVLLDVVRCPREKSQEKARTLECFSDHIGKAVYAQACEWRPANFQNVVSYVKKARAPYYLDGPSGHDWIFQNHIQESRENLLYVDYIRDITEENEPRERYWAYPHDEQFTIDTIFDYYTPPSSVTLALALHSAKITTVSGLRVIAEIWRSFVPTPDTSISELTDRNLHTVNTLLERGVLDMNKLESSQHYTLSNWPFPLWSLPVGKERIKHTEQQAILKKLRGKRKSFNEWRCEVEAIRQPPPAISKEKIEALSKVYCDAEKEREQLKHAGQQSTNSTSSEISIRSQEGTSQNEIPSWQLLKTMLRELSEEERTALLALAFLARREIADWPSAHEHAKDTVSHVGENYIAGLGALWIPGFIRWATKTT